MARRKEEEDHGQAVQGIECRSAFGDLFFGYSMNINMLHACLL